MRIDCVTREEHVYEFIIDGRKFWVGEKYTILELGYALFLTHESDEAWLCANGETIPADPEDHRNELKSGGSFFITSDPVLVALAIEAWWYENEGGSRQPGVVSIPTAFEAIEIVKNRVILNEFNQKWAGRVPGLEKYSVKPDIPRKVYREVQNPALYEQARELRLNPTPAEAALWQALRGRRLGGFKFRQQAPFGEYIVDFYCPAARLVVEVDGTQHQDQAAYDAARTQWLENKGLRVIRFRNEDVLLRLESVLDEIEKSLTPGPSPEIGRGE